MPDSIWGSTTTSPLLHRGFLEWFVRCTWCELFIFSPHSERFYLFSFSFSFAFKQKLYYFYYTVEFYVTIRLIGKKRIFSRHHQKIIFLLGIYHVEQKFKLTGSQKKRTSVYRNHRQLIIFRMVNETRKFGDICMMIFH